MFHTEFGLLKTEKDEGRKGIDERTKYCEDLGREGTKEMICTAEREVDEGCFVDLTENSSETLCLRRGDSLREDDVDLDEEISFELRRVLAGDRHTL